MLWLFLIAIVISAVLLLSYWAYHYAFKRSLDRQAEEFDVPQAEYRKSALKNIYHLLHTPFEGVSITSRDGLRLYGRYYHEKDGAPVAIFFHGYRSNYCRDGNGAFQILTSMGYNVLMADQRAHGRSEGKVISFGIKEQYDCLDWVNYVKNRFGDGVSVVLVGISMGAATVMMASDIVDPKNVKAIVEDCGYTSPRDIICHVAREIKIPPAIAYPFVYLGAYLYGSLNIAEKSSVDALKKTTIPVLFIHGESDGFVPCTMGRICYENCNSYKEILTVPGATHGVSYYVDNKAYVEKTVDFLHKFVSDTGEN